MNKVFKVIWSEARNAYVVVSEIAKNHGSKSCSTKKLLTMLIATGVMTCASMAPAMASNPASDDLNVTIGKGAHVSVWNGVTGKNITGDIAVGPNAHAWNGEYSYGSEGRIGSKEYLLDFGQGGVVGAESFFGIPYKYKVADGSKIAGSIAIGKNTVARTGSVMLGDHSYTGKLGDIEINPANAMTYNDGIYSTTLGAGAYNSGSLAAVTGALSIASGEDTQNTGATIYGSMNSIESATSNSKYSGVASSVLGFANRTQNANAALIWGTGNEVTNSVEKIGIDTDWNNVSVAEAQQKAIEAMQSSKYAGGSVMAIGGGNKADYATYSQLTGVQNKVTGTKAKAAKYDFVNGYQNTVTEASDVTVIGSKNEVTADGNKVIGDNHKVSGKNNVIFGSADKLTETTVNNAVVLGHNAKVTGEGGVALGVGSVADRANAVSVGSTGANRQIINVAAGEADTDAVNVSQLKKATANANKGWKLSTEGGTANQVASEATVDFSGKKDAGGHQNITVSNEGNNVKIELASELKNVTGVVNGNSRVTLGTGIAGITNGQESVIMMNGSTTINGVVGIDNTGKISGVANGEADKDAVNYGQLKDVKETANKGWNLSTGKGEAVNVAPGETVDFSGDKNIKVSNNGKDVKVELEKNLQGIESISNGGVKLALNGAGGTAGLINGKGASVFLMNDSTVINGVVGIDKNGKITNVAAGTAATDAVNVSQLNKVATEAGKHTQVKAGTNVGVVPSETDGTNVYTVNADGTTVSGDSNVVVTAGAKDANNVTNYGVKLNKDLKGIESVSNGAAKLTLSSHPLFGATAELTNGKASVELKDSTTIINGKVQVRQDGSIGGVTAGRVDNDAVNLGQLNDVKAEALKHTTLSDGKNTTVEATVKDGQTDYKVNVAGDLTDITSVVNGGAKLALNGAAGYAGIVNGKGASVYLQDGYTKINNQVIIDQDGKISGVAAGTADTDAVNVSQLKKVSDTANAGWTLSTNGNATAGTKVTPGAFVDFSGDQNVSVSNKGTAVSVKLNNALKDIESISNGDAKLALNGAAGTAGIINGQGASVYMQGSTTVINSKVSVDKDGKVTATAGEIGNVVLQNGVYTGHSALRDGELFVGDASGNYSQITTKGAKLGKVTIDEKGNIAGVNSIQTNALNAKYNLSVGTANENGIMPFFVNSNGAFYGANNNFSVDKDGKVTATAGEIGNVVLQNGVYTGHSALRDGELFVGDASGNYSQITTKGAKLGKVTVAADGKISGVAAGAVTADSTDAVNGSQLHAVATEASKHSKVVNGSNINVEETDLDGQKVYKVNLNKDIMLGDLTGKYVSISGTNGTIETTGAIATKDRVYADKGAKLADIDVTGNKISNGASSIVMDGSNVKVNDKVTIDQNGKISGVAAGEISSTSTDAINGSQLHQTNENVAANRADIDKNKADIAALDNRVTKNEQDIKQNAADIAQNKADIATNKADIATNKADIATNKANIAQNAADIKKVEALAKKHTTVTEGKNIKVTEGTNADGGKEYNVALDKDINLDSVTTGQTVMNNDGLKVGKDVSVTATAVTAGKTSISDEGVKVGDKTYISDKGLNANDQKVTNVAAGEISATSKDAVNGSQLYATNQEVANNTNRINKLGSRVNKVGAGAAALAALHPMDFDPDDKLTFSAGYGNYAGENAAAIGAYYRPDEKVMFSVAGTVGNGENMVNAGVSFALDRTNHVSNSRTALAREVIDLRGQLAVMGAKMAKMEKAFGMLDETKTKLFPDVPANHWAYEYIAKLAGNGYIEGYPDGNFGGDRLMTRYEFAAMLYRAIENGAALEEKIIKEFEPELGRIRVDRISGEDGDRDKIERVRVNDTKGERDHYGNKLAK